MEKSDLNWIPGDYGPHLLLSCSHLSEWQGSSLPRNGRIVEASFRWDGPGSIATDYYLACDVEDYVAVLQVGKSDAVILSGGKYPATWAYGLLIRWCYANSDEDVLEALNQPGAVPWEDSKAQFTVVEPHFLLFGSAEEADEITGDSLKVFLAPGTYRIETAHYKPNPEIYLILNRFVPVST